MTRNNAAPVSYAGNYSTDVIASKFLSFLDEALSPDTARPVSNSNLLKQENADKLSSLPWLHPSPHTPT